MTPALTQTSKGASEEGGVCVHMPPSVRIVYGSMAGHRPMTNADLCELSGLPRRTVYNALRTLSRLGVLSQRPSLHDARQTFFWLAPAAPAGTGSTCSACAEPRGANPNPNPNPSPNPSPWIARLARLSPRP
jgi:hypothetical protein